MGPVKPLALLIVKVPAPSFVKLPEPVMILPLLDPVFIIFKLPPLSVSVCPEKLVEIPSRLIPRVPAPDPEIAALMLIVPPVNESVASLPVVLLIAELTVKVPRRLLPVEIDTFVPALSEVFIFDAKI